MAYVSVGSHKIIRAVLLREALACGLITKAQYEAELKKG